MNYQQIIKETLKDARIVGVGSGRTMIGLMPFLPKHLTYVPTSVKISNILKKHDLKTMELAKTSKVDIHYDGCDVYTDGSVIIKGKGGALIAEKILIEMSKRIIIVTQEDKFRMHLAEEEIPIYVIKEGFTFICKYLESQNISHVVQMADGKKLRLADTGHNIIHVKYNEVLLRKLKQFTSVSGVGLIENLDYEVFIGNKL